MAAVSAEDPRGGRCRLSAPEFLSALETLRERAGPNPRIYAPGVAAEPYLAAEGFEHDPELARDAVFFGVWIPGVNRTDWTRFHPTTRSELIFLAPEFQEAFEAGRAAFKPLTYTQAWRWLSDTLVDAAILQVAPPDREGNCSLSLANDFTPAVWERARVLVAQINPALAPLPSAASIPFERFDAVVEAETEPRGYDAGRLPGAFAAIAEHVAGLIEDGDTLQFGLGKVQLAVLPALSNHKRLRIHSGMVSDPLVALIDADAVEAVRTGAVLGGRALAERLGAFARFSMSPVGRTHAIETLSRLRRFTAINSVIEVDLFGQANAEFIGPRQVSGGGGLLDFARGAQAAPGGRAVFALAATARYGERSRIVPRLSEGAVTIPRADVEIVVTEHGVADLRGLDIDARAEALIGVAAPEHRQALETAWSRMRRAS